MSKVYIYGLVDPFTKQVKYVGKTIVKPEKRRDQHVSDSIGKGKGRLNKVKCAWIKELVSKKSKPDVIILEEVTKANWKEREQYWINFYGLDNLTNIREGGNGSFCHSDETKEIIKETSKQRWADKEFRDSMSLAQLKSWENEDRRKHIANVSKEVWANSSESEREERAKKISQRRKAHLASLSESEMKKIVDKRKETISLKTEEQKSETKRRVIEAQKIVWNIEENRKRQREKTINQWSNMSDEDKQRRAEKIGISNKKRFEGMTEEERKEFGRKISEGKRRKSNT